jgi:hypothetical protein
VRLGGGVSYRADGDVHLAVDVEEHRLDSRLPACQEQVLRVGAP